MESKWRILVLFLACMCYLFVGAFVFSFIEGTEEETTRASLNTNIRTFLEDHPSVAFEDLRELLMSLKQAGDRGISPDQVLAINSNASGPPSSEWRRIEKPARKNWDVANAFFFSATVVTTIGMFLINEHS